MNGPIAGPKSYTFTHEYRGGLYRQIVLTLGSGHRLEVSESPTGRSVQVFLDGKKLGEAQ